ncbi:MAG: hypothetical protein AAGK37_02120 [Pseudomonadota bacterium]
MQVVFHIGAHCTSGGMLVRSLLKNRDVLAHEGVAVPGPGRYRRTIMEAIKILRGAPAAIEAQDVLLDAVLDDDAVERVILSSDNFICPRSKVLEHGELYPRIEKSAWLRNAFPAAEVGFAIALRNPATFLPALYDTLGGDNQGQGSFLSGTDPRDLAWADVIEGIIDANPEADILVWCDEDAPILWAEIMRELCGLDSSVPLDGGDDLARHILTEEGNRILESTLGKHGPETEAARRQIIGDLLMAHAGIEEAEQVINLPGWTGDLIEELTEAYDDDVATITRMPRVTLLAP